MENTLMTGDVIISEKLTIGPKLPTSPFEIPWINIAFYLNKKSRERIDSTWWRYNRLKGIRRINHNDIVLFNHRRNDEMVIVKRCVGIPGETVQILNADVYIDNKIQSLPQKAKTKYFLYLKKGINNFNKIDSLGITVSGRFIRENAANLSVQEKLALESLNICDSIVKEIQQNDTVPKAYPWDKQFNWTFDNYGPIVVPQKGLSIPLNSDSYALYKDIINYYEENQITSHNNRFFINNQEASTYTFIQDYYWMMGDNRHNSMDSRAWGFVPERNIIGRAWVVLFSKDYDGFKWKRVLKRVR